MDFPYCPNGWVPMTMEEKKHNEKCLKRNKEKTINSIKESEHELQWKFVRIVAEVYGKNKKVTF